MKQSITIDFDGTLTKKEVQKYVKFLKRNDIDVWVLTSRYDDLIRLNYNTFTKDNNDLWSVIDSLKIAREKVIFTSMDLKSNYLSKTKVIWHLDDDEITLEDINKKSNTIGIQINSNNWECKCNKLLNLC